MSCGILSVGRYVLWHFVLGRYVLWHFVLGHSVLHPMMIHEGDDMCSCHIAPHIVEVLKFPNVNGVAILTFNSIFTLFDMRMCFSRNSARCLIEKVFFV